MSDFCTSGALGVPDTDSVSATALWQVGGYQDFGGVTCIYAKAGAGGTAVGTVCTIRDGVATAIADTANQACPLCIGMAAVAADSYGWFAVKGTVPVLCGTTVAVGDDLFIQGAGVAGATAEAGKQLLGVVCVEAKTYTSSNVLAKATLQYPIAQGATS